LHAVLAGVFAGRWGGPVPAALAKTADRFNSLALRLYLLLKRPILFQGQGLLVLPWRGELVRFIGHVELGEEAHLSAGSRSHDATLWVERPGNWDVFRGILLFGSAEKRLRDCPYYKTHTKGSETRLTL